MVGEGLIATAIVGGIVGVIEESFDEVGVSVIVGTDSNWVDII